MALPYNYGIIDYSAVRGLIFQSLYSPYGAFPVVAHFLSELEAGTVSDLHLEALLARADPDCPPKVNYPNLEVGQAIMCMDGDAIDASLEHLKVHYEKLSKISTFADIWSQVHARCR